MGCTYYTPSDDGYTGLNYERPGFQAMISSIMNNKSNVSGIIVKDFSRFGRNRIETLRYIRKTFPRLNIRFIAICDDYDSSLDRCKNDHIGVSFRIIANQESSGDTSRKVRSILYGKMKIGEFIGSFPVYGYQKKGRLLIPDEYAANVVREIFQLKVKGYSHQGIADLLNDKGVLSPVDYKEHTGSNFKTSFKRKHKSEWTCTSIRRILQDEVYTGVLIQRKVMKINYMSKKRIITKADQQIRVEGTHEPIIDAATFQLVQKLLNMDIRVSAGERQLNPFSGLLYCSDCKEKMVRKSETHKGKKYIYYVCSTNKRTKQCHSHRINEEKLVRTVYNTLARYIASVVDYKNIINKIDIENLKTYKVDALRKNLFIMENELESAQRIYSGLYEDFKKNILTESEYQDLKYIYTKEIQDDTQKIRAMEDEINKTSSEELFGWMSEFEKFKNFDKLDFSLLVHLVDKIYVDKNMVDIRFYHMDEFEALKKSCPRYEMGAV